MIEISHLYKWFGAVQAVEDLSFRVREGQLFAFLGVNGVGKSTTINILCVQLCLQSFVSLVLLSQGQLILQLLNPGVVLVVHQFNIIYHILAMEAVELGTELLDRDHKTPFLA